jgi:hypothetical protein
MKPLDPAAINRLDDAARSVEVFQSACKMHYGTGNGG